MAMMSVIVCIFYNNDCGTSFLCLLDLTSVCICHLSAVIQEINIKQPIITLTITVLVNLPTSNDFPLKRNALFRDFFLQFFNS